jgi:hypothetical protein
VPEGVGKGVVLALALLEPTVVERVPVPVVGVVVEAVLGVLSDGVERAVVECLAAPQAATPSTSTTATIVR